MFVGEFNAIHTHHLSLSHLYFCLAGKLNLCAMHNADNRQKEDAPVIGFDGPNLPAFY